MPDLNGLQTLMELRRNESWRRTPVVMMRNASSLEERDASYEAGANPFLVNPAGLEPLRETLEMVCH
ncbi:response regulator [Spirosoma aerolatum]|uniref:response regulator n=1 Tax=Spirosoma aerolatum TaxID=1211326 RepID=UPI00147503A8|nr:response regulator [Spirosoma aerolatum]